MLLWQLGRHWKLQTTHSEHEQFSSIYRVIYQHKHRAERKKICISLSGMTVWFLLKTVPISLFSKKILHSMISIDKHFFILFVRVFLLNSGCPWIQDFSFSAFVALGLQVCVTTRHNKCISYIHDVLFKKIYFLDAQLYTIFFPLWKCMKKLEKSMKKPLWKCTSCPETKAVCARK